MCHYFAAVILAILLFALYSAGAWVMLRSVANRRLDPLAWGLTLAALIAHTERSPPSCASRARFPSGLPEALSLLAWTLAVLAIFIAIERQNRVLGAILLGQRGRAARRLTGHGPHLCREPPPGAGSSRRISCCRWAPPRCCSPRPSPRCVLVFLERRLRSRRIADLPKVLPPLDALETGDVPADRRRLRPADPLAAHRLRSSSPTVRPASGAQDRLVDHRLGAVRGAADRRAYATDGAGAPRCRWTLWGFGVLVLSYFGSKFVLEYLLGRHWG